jgi:hypothetical protein
MQKLKRFAELVQKDPEQNYLLHNIIGIYDPAFYTRYGVHAYLFGGAIAGALAAPLPYMISASHDNSPLLVPSTATTQARARTRWWPSTWTTWTTCASWACSA